MNRNTSVLVLMAASVIATPLVLIAPYVAARRIERTGDWREQLRAVGWNTIAPGAILLIGVFAAVVLGGTALGQSAEAVAMWGVLISMLAALWSLSYLAIAGACTYFAVPAFLTVLPWLRTLGKEADHDSLPGAPAEDSHE